jgi:hypothetical protein
MTKLYGQLIGAPLQNLRTTGMLSPIAPVYGNSRDALLVRDGVTLNGNVIGDTISLATLRATAFIDPVFSIIAWEALGAGVTLSIGDAAHPGGLLSAYSVAGASNTGMVAFGFPAAQIAAPLWQRLGYASNPGGVIELLASFGGANPANVNLSWEIWGRNT